MRIADNVASLRQRLAGRGRVAFVPTMGNLHAGHIELVRRAREHGDCVVASIFVNPLQFGPNEDFQRYPRSFDADCAQLEAAGCDLVFAPAVTDMYPVAQQYFVEPPAIASELCGAFRPGHFRGVATVVLKLFNLVQPQVALFGKKDYQQLAIIRGMVEAFNLAIDIIGCETVRAADGLALSSRNGYLSADERAEAVRLIGQLTAIRQAVRAGASDFDQLEKTAAAELAAHGWRVDYLSVRDAASLLPAQPGSGAKVVLGAAWLGNTRLIDNVEI